ncbi:hypothetical protein [Xanthovirga aplysinae]|uniref:hypothetical protein n=1 Tax=Xanthovirga aplysinae TaxID=2529853 RepID=UPI0012BD316B|nr:hypothetical protein [Xanthovirga aplysinae]
MPLFILFVGTLRGTWDLKKRKKAFQTFPFSELSKHGFDLSLKHEESKRTFSEQILVGRLEGFQILAEVNTQHAANVIRFQALTEIKPISRKEIKRLHSKFKKYDIELDFQGVTKKISIKDGQISTYRKLNTSLKEFIEIIKSENFEPKNEAANNGELPSFASD